MREWLIDVWGVRSAVLETSLSPDDVRHRLWDLVEGENGRRTGRPFIGYVRDAGARLKMRTWEGPPLKIMHVRWDPDGTGARLRCRVEIGPLSTAVFMILVALLVLFAPVAMVVLVIVSSAEGLIGGVSLLPILVLLGLVGLHAMNRAQAKPQDQYLIEFVATATEARGLPDWASKRGPKTERADDADDEDEVEA